MSAPDVVVRAAEAFNRDGRYTARVDDQDRIVVRDVDSGESLALVWESYGQWGWITTGSMDHATYLPATSSRPHRVVPIATMVDQVAAQLQREAVPL